jgi:2-polyprenyl-3-methyl-5-hydroxy-6-metoxy-1,4-benzoquinol methylase
MGFGKVAMNLQEAQRLNLVSAQWRAVEDIEGMSANQARVVYAVRLRTQSRRAANSLAAIKPWPLLPERNLRVYQNWADTTRIWRVCRFLSAEDRILDIGIAHGWMLGMIAQNVGPAYYAGIDLDDSKFDSVSQMAEVNGLDLSRWFIGVKDLYDLTAEWVSEHNPTVVLLLEVLEHLPDPQRALKTIADAISTNTQLLFSVPLYGRVESCWGHVSLFNAERVRRLCAQAGLFVHWVEPVANAWQLLLVSRSPEAPRRLARLVDETARRRIRLPVRLARPGPMLDADPSFHRVRLDPGRLVTPMWTGGLSQYEVLPDSAGGIRLTATAGGGRRAGNYAAVAFPVDGLRVLRFELTVPAASAISRLSVEGRDDAGGRTVWWDLSAIAPRRLPTTATTYVLRPGRGSAGFRAARPRAPDSTRVVELVMRIKPRSSASLVLRRVAYVR